MNKVLLVILVLLSTVCFGQRKSIANKYFNEYAYKKSAQLYESIFNKGDDSYDVLSRLGDSYYFNSDFDLSEKWYKKLLNKYESIVDAKYIFRYAQSLKSNGKIKESDKWILKLEKENKDDFRVKSLKENLNYFAEYSNRKKTFVNLKNLSTNTKYSDFGGFIFNNDFYFASTKPDDANDRRLYEWNNQPHLNIYKAKQSYNSKNEILDIVDQVKIESVSSKYHESNAVITSDGNIMYFTRTNFDGKKLKRDKNKSANLKIYKAENIRGEWSNIKELPFNNDNYSIGHPALSPDEKTLYFISDMPNGFGLTDLYKVNILDENTYSIPENLGETINTKGREMFPFVGSDNTLYFSSDGHLGLGALDIFEVKKKEGIYTDPINLGTPVNGLSDDFSFVINTKRSNGFFSSNRKNGKGDDDIYSFIIYKCKEDVTGFISEAKTNQPIYNAVVKLIDEKGKVIVKKTTDKNGTYSFEFLNCEKEYTVTASKNDYKSGKIVVKTLDKNKHRIITNFQLESLIVEDQIVINPIYFDFNKHNIRDDAAYELEHIVSVMKNNPEMIIKIESHTDSRGERIYNKFLSDKRAKSTRDYIVSRGISLDRIQSAIGYGEEQLLNDCNQGVLSKCSEKEHQENRRSYFYIVNQKDEKKKYEKKKDLSDNFFSQKKDLNSIKDTLLYKIQIGSFKNKNVFFSKIKNVEVVYLKGCYKYYCCKKSSYIEIKKEQKRIRNLGYKDAFIIAFLNGKKITIKEALKISR